MPSIYLSKYSRRVLSRGSPYAARYPLDLWGRCPHCPWQGARPPAPQQEGLSPPRAARHPTLAVGQRGRRSPAPIGIAYGAGDATGARGFALRALLILGGAAPCGTARTPFRCICSLLGCGAKPRIPASTKFNERSEGKIPFRVIRSRHTVRADFRVSRKRNS